METVSRLKPYPGEKMTPPTRVTAVEVGISSQILDLFSQLNGC